MENAFAHPIATVLANFDVDEHDGLSNKQVEDLRNKHGRNGTHWPSPCDSLWSNCPQQEQNMENRILMLYWQLFPKSLLLLSGNSS